MYILFLFYAGDLTLPSNVNSQYRRFVFYIYFSTLTIPIVFIRSPLNTRSQPFVRTYRNRLLNYYPWLLFQSYCQYHIFYFIPIPLLTFRTFSPVIINSSKYFVWTDVSVCFRITVMITSALVSRVIFCLTIQCRCSLVFFVCLTFSNGTMVHTRNGWSHCRQRRRDEGGNWPTEKMWKGTSISSMIFSINQTIL